MCETSARVRRPRGCAPRKQTLECEGRQKHAVGLRTFHVKNRPTTSTGDENGAITSTICEPVMMWNEREGRAFSQDMPPSLTQACHTYSTACDDLKFNEIVARQEERSPQPESSGCLKLRRTLCCGVFSNIIDWLSLLSPWLPSKKWWFPTGGLVFPQRLLLKPKHHDEETKLKTDTETRAGGIELLAPPIGTRAKRS